jgi:phosphoglycolate phosphatase-like HAD superfamily hydrolase
MQFWTDRGITAPRAQVYEWYHRKAKHAEAKLFPDVVPTLRILRRKELNVRLAVVSAQKNAVLARQLRHVTSYFDLVVGEKEHKHEELARLRDLHEIPADRVYYVGDFASDMHAARKARVRAIGITRGRKTKGILRRAGAHTVIDDLDGLLKLLEW